MADYTFGTPATPPLETPEKARRSRKDASAGTPQAPRSDAPRQSQAQLLEERADELEALFRRLPAAGEAPAPVDENDSTELSGVDFVVDRWKRLLSDGDAAAAAGVPPRTLAWIEAPTGAVVVRVQVPPGCSANAVARSLKSYVTASAWGEYQARPHVDPQSFYLIRRHAGGDLATPFRVASAVAEQFRTDAESMRRRVLNTAGLVVARPMVRDGRHHLDKDGKPAFIRTVPELINASEWSRGVEFVLKIVPGQDVSDYEKATEKLAKMFGRPVQIESRDRGLVAVRLVTKPAGQLPKNVVLTPSSMHRPQSSEQAVKIAKQIELPVGLTRTEDGSIERVSVRPAKTPHGIVVGESGLGKSRWIRSAASGWALEGGWLVICDPKQGELVDRWLPGTVCIATNTATISRTIWWARTEMLTRLKVQDVLKKRGISPAPFQPIMILFDEFGQLHTELSQSSDPAEQAAAKALVTAIVKMMQLGRSVGVHLCLISQNAKVESIPSSIALSANWRFVAGRPTEATGSTGTVDRLFPSSMKDAARELGATIPGGTPGYALLDWNGKPTVAKTFYGYTPGEEPEDPQFAGLPAEVLQSWREMRGALGGVPPVRRFGWKPGPDTPENWTELSLYAGKKGDDPTVKSLQPVWLDDIGPDGRPVPIDAHKIYDPLSDEYDSIGEPLDLDGHVSPTAL